MLPVRLLSGRIDYHLALENRPHDTAIYSQCCQIPAEMVHYGMTKTAEIAVARGIAELVAGTGVTVNSILAGPTESEGVGAFVEAMAKQENKSKANPRFARYEKNPAPVPFQHPCEIVSREPHSAHHVYLKEAVPVRIGNLCKRLGLENAHIVHQYIHRWEFRNHVPCAG